MTDDWLRAAAEKRKAATAGAREAAQKSADVEQHARKVFDEQVGAVWSTICQRLKKQADDYNKVSGEELDSEIHEALGEAALRFTKGSAGVGFALDREKGVLSAWRTDGGPLDIRWILPVDLYIDGDTLQVY